MKKIFFGCIVLLMVFVFTGSLYTAVPASERAALIAFYNSAGGDNWNDNSGWKDGTLEPDGFGPVGSESSWKGITVSNDHVSSIFLSNNNLTGSIPGDLGNLTHLTSLILYNNLLTGTIPTQVGNISTLRTLNINYNRLTGAIPPELANLSNLVFLELSHNQLTGSIPPELGNLPNLIFFKLNHNQLSGSIPPELGNLSKVTHFILFFNQLTGSIPPELGNLAMVSSFSLGFNQLTGSIPPELGKLSNVTMISLDINNLTGSIPPELGNLSNLNTLALNHNQLSGSIPPELGNLSKLEFLSLHYNQLTGTIPPELGNLSKLDRLNLYTNQLTGSIPPELGNLSILTTLSLDSNQLTGTIPPELGNLSKLESFSIKFNRLSGSIPPELGKLANLAYLNLSRNQLSGSIPPELGKLANLTALLVYSNQLTGPFPTELQNLSKLVDGDSDFMWNGLYSDDADLKAFLSSKQINADWESTQTIPPTGLSAAALTQTSIRVSWTPTLYTADSGGYKVYYSTSSGGPWTFSGMTTDKTASFYDVTGLYASATYYFVVQTQTNAHALNENTVVSDYSEPVSASTSEPPVEINPPFGAFETPLHGSTVSSSIPVSGWALDDSGIMNVKIYRGEGNNLIYIGDAVQIEGARPDVAAAYPGYPNNTKAGWGYMLLTNFLPDGGNGTFVLHAIATDITGKSTTLGTITIICDNANAVKPFGAIDTPTQGGTAYGNAFVNWGWVLTPQPNSIPTDGSTIDVFIDGVYLGHPTYNIYREDIAALFPGYTNSGGAVGYFTLDTTAYADGVHTIYWTAEDDAGNSDGIGSRYFSINNATGTSSMALGTTIESTRRVPVDYSGSVGVINGYNRYSEPTAMYPDDNGTIYIEMEELGRVEIHFIASSSTGDARIINGSPLPIGSTLDSENGIFYWMAGPGFVGDYSFVFIKETPNGKTMNTIIIRILPKSNTKR